MASISHNSKTGLRMLLVVCHDGKRRPIRLGRMTARQADDIKRHVEALASRKKSGEGLPDSTAEWLGAISDTLRSRLVLWGLAEPKAKPEPEPEPEPKLTLGDFLADFMAKRADMKPSTRVALGQCVRYLTEYFGADKPIDAITPGDADEWRQYLIRPHRGRKGLADNTVRRRSGAAKQFFKAAVRKGFLPSNPFVDLKAAVRGNPAREYFITRAEAQKVLDACPDAEWRLIFALCRFGGLRCPSEVLTLTWDDIHWDTGRFTVHSPKTEHHEGGESRIVPLFPELLPHLREVFEAAEPGTVPVIQRYRHTNQNLSTKLGRILHKAGLTRWPKLYQNLRSTRQTELTNDWPVHKVCAWLGNSPAVAFKHYLQKPTDDDYEKAAQKAAQHPAVKCFTEREGKTGDVQERPDLPQVTEVSTNVHKNRVGDTGLEPVTSCVSSRRSSRLS